MAHKAPKEHVDKAQRFAKNEVKNVKEGAKDAIKDVKDKFWGENK